MSLRYTQNWAMQFPKGSLVFCNSPFIYCLQSFHFLHITPTQTKATISVLQSSSLLGFLILPHTWWPASGHSTQPLVNPGYWRSVAPLPALWRGFRWWWGLGCCGRWREGCRARAKSFYRDFGACPLQCWCIESLSFPQMQQNLLEVEVERNKGK